MIHINCQIAIKPRRSLFNLSLNRSPWSWHVPKENVGSTEKRILIYTYINSSPYSMTDHINYIFVITWSIVNNNKTRKVSFLHFIPTQQKTYVVSISDLEVYIFFLLLGFRKERNGAETHEVFLLGTKTVNSLLLILIYLGKNRVID